MPNIWSTIGRLIPKPVVHAFEDVLARYWTWRSPGLDPQPVAPIGWSPGDNLQLTMNLVMPLADKTAVGRAKAMGAIAASIDELFVGLDNVGTVHFARFDIIDGNLCMISVFDGDFRAYIRDFIVVFGSVFDALMAFVEDPPTTPCAQNVEEFIDWIAARDAFHIPGGVSTMFPNLQSLSEVPRDLVVLMQENPNVQLGIYRGYPSFSVPQIRDGLGVGW